MFFVMYFRIAMCKQKDMLREKNRMMFADMFWMMFKDMARTGFGADDIP